MCTPTVVVGKSNAANRFLLQQLPDDRKGRRGLTALATPARLRRRRLKTRPPRQIGWVISVEDWALIRRLVADGVPQRQVARDLGIGRSTVARALASGGPPKYERPSVATSFTPFEPAVRQLLAKTPDVPATVIAERVGWTGSITWFRDNVRQLRPDHRRVDPADRLIWLPGEAAQCDLWFPPKKIPLESPVAKSPTRP